MYFNFSGKFVSRKSVNQKGIIDVSLGFRRKFFSGERGKRNQLNFFKYFIFDLIRKAKKNKKNSKWINFKIVI